MACMSACDELSRAGKEENSPAGYLSETGGSAKGSRSEVQGLRNFEPRTSDRVFVACLVLHAPRSVAHGKRRVSVRRGRAGEKTDCFSVLPVLCLNNGVDTTRLDQSVRIVLRRYTTKLGRH